MTTDRDIERILGRWLTDGPLEVPDRAFDEAVDRVRRTRQRPAWRLRWRQRPMITPFRLAAVAAAAVIVAAVGITLSIRPSDSGVGAGPLRSFVADDVDRIVLDAPDAPSGTTLQARTIGPSILTDPVFYVTDFSERQRFLEMAGFVHARQATYGGVEPDEPLYVSEGLLFDDAAAAEAAMAIYETEYRTGYGFANAEPSDPDLGDRSLLFAGPAAVQNGEPGFYYMWRTGNLLLNAVGVGPLEGDALEAMEANVRTMALEMDRRTR